MTENGFSYTLDEIARITGGFVLGQSSVKLNRILTDSRSLNMPGETLFVAIKGSSHDGHNYIQDLYNKGVRQFMVTSMVRQPSLFPAAGFLCVDDTLKAIQKLAAHYRSQYTAPVTAITGSNGKTVVKEWLAGFLSGYKNVLRSPKSYNSQLGVPLSVFLLNSRYDLAVFEAGISFPGEMGRLQEILRPDTGIFTNIGPAHQENFEDTRHKISEKLILFKGVSTLIFCSDHSLVRQQVTRFFEGSNTRLLSWSVGDTGEVRVHMNEKSDQGTEIHLVFKTSEYRFSIPFSDKASRENAIHCAVWWVAMGFDFDVFAARSSEIEPVSMRLEVKEGINDTIVVNDSFNSDLYSLRIAMDTLHHQARGRGKVVVLSDILQSGYNPDILYQEVAEIMNRNAVTFFVGVGGTIAAYRDMFQMPTAFFADVATLINQLHAIPLAKSAVLLKGARQFRFEQLMKRLEKKVHETLFEINLNALAHNLAFYRTLLPAGTRVMVMVKAFSYGSGMLEIANLLQFNRADYLAVAFADEGVELRRNGVSLPVMVMNPDTDSFDTIVEYNLEPEIYSFRTLETFSNLIAKIGISGFPVHIKIDTGMHRLGFGENDISGLIALLNANPALRVASVFSHLAASEDHAEDEFTRAQLDRFKSICDRIVRETGKTFLRHIANTSAIERFPDAAQDMVRLGIGLYGFSSLYGDKLEPAGCLRTSISQIRTLTPGDTVGYNRKGKVTRDAVIATLPIGYADGIFRSLGNGNASFYINRKKAPTIGNICMDMCMIDITGIPSKEGDEVVLFRNTEDVAELSRAAGTIPYEFLVHISQRVKRIYMQE